MKAVSKGTSTPPDQQPRIPRNSSRRPSEQERRKYTELQKLRDANAARLGIDPTIIANRNMLSELAQDWETNAPQIMRWQKRLLEEAV